MLVDFGLRRSYGAEVGLLAALAAHIAGYAGKPCCNRSASKAAWPGRKRVYRACTPAATLVHATVALLVGPQPGKALLVPVMRSGKHVGPPERIDSLRKRVNHELTALPAYLRSPDLTPERFRVEIANSVRTLAAKMDGAV